MKPTRGEKIFGYFNNFFLFLFALLMIFPVVYVLKISLDVGPKSDINLSLIPKEASLVFYRMIFNKPNIARAFMTSVKVTLIGTIISVVLEAFGAYSISKKDLPGYKFLTYMLIVPMMFSGGIIPLYLVVKGVGLLNSFWSLILPSCISGWNMILMRNYYWSIHESLKESARIDGASEITVFLRIILPLSQPVLAAIGLFTFVGYWNSFYNALMFITDPAKYPFTLVLREMITLAQSLETQGLQSGLTQEQLSNVNSESLSAAMIVVSIIPVVIVYPFMQKYFVKGIMVGSVKG